MENNKYQEGKIYKIVCNITNEIYYGSTIQTLEKRLISHKTRKSCVSRNIINRDNYKIELIKDYPCNNLKELEEEESNYIRNNICINKQIPNRTDKEWREDNKEKLKQDKKNWYKNNYQEKKDTYNKNQREYYEKNKEEINKKITCECGAIVNRRGLLEHKKSMKHLRKTECLIID
tara:strand:- start:9 stop:536 length:528 start_codon:yes stop_codon:yes gene_type:complete